MDYLKAFLIGGAICALVQILMDKTKLMPGRIMVLLVCSGVVLGFLGVYEPFIEWAGSGASVPLLGFGNTLFKGCLLYTSHGFLYHKCMKPGPLGVNSCRQSGRT